MPIAVSRISHAVWNLMIVGMCAPNFNFVWFLLLSCFVTAVRFEKCVMRMFLMLQQCFSKKIFSAFSVHICAYDAQKPLSRWTSARTRWEALVGGVEPHPALGL